jgi:site-specific recombinase XerC
MTGFACRQPHYPQNLTGPRAPEVRQSARLLNGWLADIRLGPSTYGTPSLRCTYASLIYQRTKNIRAAKIRLGHTKLENTVRYLRIEVDDALELAEQAEV